MCNASDALVNIGWKHLLENYHQLC